MRRSSKRRSFGRNRRKYSIFRSRRWQAPRSPCCGFSSRIDWRFTATPAANGSSIRPFSIAHSTPWPRDARASGCGGRDDHASRDAMRSSGYRDSRCRRGWQPAAAMHRDASTIGRGEHSFAERINGRRRRPATGYAMRRQTVDSLHRGRRLDAARFDSGLRRRGRTSDALREFGGNSRSGDSFLCAGSGGRRARWSTICRRGIMKRISYRRLAAISAACGFFFSRRGWIPRAGHATAGYCGWKSVRW